MLMSILLVPSVSKATETQWLTFTMNDNTELLVAAENLNINYSDLNLHLKSGTVDRLIPVSDIRVMQFTSSSSGMVHILNDNESGNTDYYNLSGVKVGSFASPDEARKHLSPDAYIIKNGRGTAKIIF